MRWSGARLSHAAASPRNASVQASRKLVHSTTNASTSRSRAVDERHVGVAGGHGAHAAGGEHLDGPQRGRRLAVGAGDGEHRPRPARPLLLPAVGQLELADHRPPERGGRRRTGGASRARRAPGRRRSPAATSAGEPVVVGPGSTSSTSRSAARRRLASSTRVVGGDDVEPALAQRPHGRRAGDGQPVDEDHGRSAEIRGEVADEQAERGGDAHRRDQPEADDHRRLRPAEQLEVVVDRRHPEQPPRAPAGLEHAPSAGPPSRPP